MNWIRIKTPLPVRFYSRIFWRFFQYLLFSNSISILFLWCRLLILIQFTPLICELLVSFCNIVDASDTINAKLASLVFLKDCKQMSYQSFSL